MQKIIMFAAILAILLSVASLDQYFDRIKLAKAEALGRCSVAVAVSFRAPLSLAKEACECVVDKAEPDCLDDVDCYVLAVSFHKSCLKDVVKNLMDSSKQKKMQ